MHFLSKSMLAGTLAILGALTAPATKADTWNRRSVVTFDGPVEIPGVHLTGWKTLPAGTYMFKLLDSHPHRNVLQVLNKEETTAYATILAIPNFRLKATDRMVLPFSGRAAGESQALRAWFYPGRGWGEEFVYSRARALELAKATNSPVLFSPVEMPEELNEPVSSAEAPIVTEMKKAPIMAITPAGEEIQLAEAVTGPPAEDERAAASLAKAGLAPVESAKTEQAAAVPPKAELAALPATGSSLGLVSLMGLLAVAGAIALKSGPGGVR